MTTEEQSERGHAASFEDGGRDSQAKECRQLHKASRGEGMDLPLRPPGGNTAQLTRWF